jgi:hypothetical protein
MKKLIYILALIPFAFSCTKEVKNPSSLQQAASINVSEATVSAIKFGVKFDDSNTTISEEIEVLKKLGTSYVRVPAESLKDYKGGNNAWIDKAVPAGVKALLCINWERAGRTRQFPRDLATYETKLRMFLNKYASKIEVAICENEPTTDKFFGSDPMKYYIAELKVFARVCNEYGVRCADGGIHTENIRLVMNGKLSGGKNAPEVKELLDAYKIIPLDYVNIHFKVGSSGFSPGELKNIADYTRNYTGKGILSNEMHSPPNDLPILKNVMSQVKEAQFVYALKWSGGDYDSPVNKGTTLTSYGTSYKSLIP